MTTDAAQPASTSANDTTPTPATASAQDLVLLTVDGPVATVRLNAAATRNALSMDMMNSLIETFMNVADRTDVRVVILESAGHVFSSGHNLKEVRGADLDTQQQIFSTCAQLMLLITRIPQPVIAKVQGVATAAGCQLVATCDLAVASDEARFATPGVSIGLFCSTPMVALSRAVPRKTALRMLLTGDMLPADHALQYGLVSDVVPAAELDAATRALADQVATASSATVTIGKEAFYRQIHLPLEDAYGQMAEVMAENAVMPDAQEGIDAFLSKRTPVWQHRQE